MSTTRPEQPLAIYVSAHSHSSVDKGALLAGFGRANLRLVPFNAEYGMRADALEELVQRDLAAGVRPSAGAQSKAAQSCSTFHTATPADPRRASMPARASFGLCGVCGSSQVTCSRGREQLRSFARCPSSGPSIFG